MLAKSKRRGRKSSSKKSNIVYNTTDSVVKSDLLSIDFDQFVIIQLSVKRDDLNKELDPVPYAPDMMEFALIESNGEEIDEEMKITRYNL